MLELLQTLVEFLPAIWRITLISGGILLIGFIITIALGALSVETDSIFLGFLSFIPGMIAGIAGFVLRITFTCSLILFIIKLVIGA